MVHKEIVKSVTNIILIGQVKEKHDQEEAEEAEQAYLLDQMLISKFSHTHFILLKCHHASQYV